MWAMAALPGGRLACGDFNSGLVRVINAATGACEAELLGHASGIRSVLLLPDGRLATGSDDKTIRMWDLASKACVAVLEGHITTVCALTVYRGQLVSGSADGQITVWA